MRKRADGSGTEEVLLNSPVTLRPASWSNDGKFLLYELSTAPSFLRYDLWVLPMEKGAKPFRLTDSGSGRPESEASFSPDGHYICYYSGETGTAEIYVRSFSPVPGAPLGGKWMISNAGGHSPMWSADGKKLYWRSLETRSKYLMSASSDIANGFHAGPPEKVVDIGNTVPARTIVISHGRALLPVAVAQQPGVSINVIFNWQSLLRLPL